MIKLPFKKFVAFVIAMFVLFTIPVYTIMINTNTLKDGTEYYFKIEAYDPYDMFRGNYLSIAFEENVIPAYSDYLDLDYNEKCYATIGVNAEGYAYFNGITEEVPTNTSAYYETTARYRSWEDGYVVTTPTRYYMNEDKSLKAEDYLNENIENAYVKVRVKNGKMVIVGLYVNDLLIDTID